MYNPSTGRYEPGWRPRENIFEDAEGVPIDPGLIEGEGEGRWKDIINTKTGEHSVKIHELKVVKTWCKEGECFFVTKGPASRDVECNKCGREGHYILGMQKLENGKIISLVPIT